MRKAKVKALAKNVVSGWIGVYIDSITYGTETAAITFAISLPHMSGIVYTCTRTVYDGFEDALEIIACDELIEKTIASIWRV